ncbi:NAD(P)-dependent oxidoreductase [Fodinicurvata fenggangensis]|uniref:NAD(P)-dependent oxidoreductase n=1 Tax=Fodinicurvata fenggangensis TaxID=1121830 RepID=UPI00047D01A3|nr:NAD(P)-dependent oxidoreductase [Fodinicurvata fenggangensis]
MAKLAFLGLGVMGYPMAGHLAKAGHDVRVYNRTAEKASKWAQEHGGQTGATPAEAAAEADIVFMCVGNDDDVRKVVYGENGALAGMKNGAILVDHTTASAEVAREVEKACKDDGKGFLDAPVSGGQAGAENGALTIMVGGDEKTFDSAKSAMDCYGRAVTLMGDAGSGQLTKMVNQICIAGLVQGLAEGVNFAQKAGLDCEKVFDVIGKGAAQSWQMDNRHKTMLEDKFDHGFAVDWMRKDLNIALAEAQRNGSQLPVTALVDQFYAAVQGMGGGRWDTSSLLKNLKD